MSLTLGEKLRQAREELGISLSEVSEQTRISPHYLESIENDDYSTLPGGIFNKGFVKSYAKFVDLDEQEALRDYASLISADSGEEAELKLYKPEVLSDDRSMRSMAPTILLAIVILGGMTVGVLYLVDYLRHSPSSPLAGNTNANSTANLANASTPEARPAAPDLASTTIEFRALTQSVSLSSMSDGKTANSLVNAGSSVTFEPKESLKLSYSKSLAQSVELKINGKVISLPSVPLQANRNAIEFEINKDNLAQIWERGSISGDVPPATPEGPANTDTPQTATTPDETTAATPRPNATPIPSPAATTRTVTSTPVPRASGTPRPAGTPRPPAANAAANRPE